MAEIRSVSKIRTLVLCIYLGMAFSAWGRHTPLIMPVNQINKAKQLAKTSAERSMAWQYIVKTADSNSEKKSLDKAEYTALVYSATHQQRYADQLKDILQNMIKAKSWGISEFIMRTPSWHSELNMAHKGFKAAIAFDAVKESLNSNERKQIAHGIYRLALQPLAEDWIIPETRIHALNSMGHNWWSACVSMAGVLALALYDDIPEAQKLPQMVDESLQQWLSFEGDILQNKQQTFDEGGSYEGINYTGYGLQEALLFYMAYQNSGIGKNNIPAKMLNSIPDFFFHSCYPRTGNLWNVNFGDSYSYNSGRNCLMLLASMGIRTKEIAWYISQIKEDCNEDYTLKTPMGWLYTPNLENAASTIDIPTSHLYANMGWAMMRTNWHKDADALYVKSGFTWNHSHADAASFVLCHNGVDIIKDAGKCWYKKDEYRNYFFQSEGHNVVLFNDRGQQRRQQYYGTPISGSLHHLIDDGALKYILADATGPNADRFSRYFRHYLWIGKVLLIIDDLQTYDKGKFQWLWHPGGNAVKRGTDLYITQGKSSVILRPIYPKMLAPSDFLQDYPDDMYWQTHKAPSEGLKGEEEYYSFHLPEETNRVKAVTAIILRDSEKDNNLPQIERIEGKDWIGLRITEGDIVKDIYINQLADGRLMHVNSWINAEGWQTDAYMLMVEHSLGKANYNKLFMIYGSSLLKDGKSYYSSLKKQNVISKHGHISNYEVN